jgi:hypothetical protein
MEIISYKNKQSLEAMAKALNQTHNILDITNISISFRIYENGKTKQLHIFWK